MWIPLFLNYNEQEMKEMGFRLTAEDVYSVNHHSMKDAIVLFGRGCTGELISANGLLLTNHHCGYSYVQSHSTLENNYLHNGFWAKDLSEEIPNPGLTATFLIRMEEVTDKILEGTTEDMCELEREKLIAKNSEKLIREAIAGTHYTAIIEPFYYGNQYFLFVNEVFKDVRLVGTPPESIGKFGGDTDNWMWPRHTGDFSLYRVYADKEGKPADYSPDNLPLSSKQFFKLSTKGVQEDDFTLVFGYPGSTEQFLLSDAVKQITEIRNPVAIHQRGVRLDIMKKEMDKSLEIRLMYSAKANSISNGWKKWIGENKGLAQTDAIEKKIRKEEEFAAWVTADEKRKEQYGTVLTDLKNYYAMYQPYMTKGVYFRETFPAIELFRFIYTNVMPLIILAEKKDLTVEQWEIAKEKMLPQIDAFYSKFYKPIDKEVFVHLLHYYFSTIDPMLIPSELQRYIANPISNFQTMADEIYEKSVFADKENFLTFVKKAKPKEFTKLGKSLPFQLLLPAYNQYFDDMESMDAIYSRMDTYYRIYVKALQEKDAGKKVFYPDANLTMRVTYGQVKGFYPEDGKEYLYYTTLAGVMEKEDPNVFDYKVDEKLKKLYEEKDYGIYANEKGELPIAFIASNHTTGGNSGSPVINATGELIGVNFDRVWEGTMSDINYDVSRCRNISVDIRYFLFILDKHANAQNLLNELIIVN